MNKKVNILIVSTRDVGKKGTIFEHAKRLDKTSLSLKKYFWEKNRKELDKYVQLDLNTNGAQITSSNNPNALAEFAVKVFDTIKNELEDEVRLNVRNYSMGIKRGIDLDSNFHKLTELLRQLPNELKTKVIDFDNDFETARNAYTPGRKSTFELEDFDNEKYLVMPAINTDNHSLENKRNPDGSENPLTLRDRISLFSVKDPEENVDNYCYLYSVLTLKDEDDDTNGNKWIECLTLSVIEELELKDDVDVNLIIMLHDKDLKSTSSETFKTIRDQDPLQIRKDDKGRKTVQFNQKEGHMKRSLIVFNHPNHFYRQLTIRNSDKVTASKIFEDVKKGTVYSLNEQRIKDISQQIATFKEGENLASIKSKCEEIKADAKEDIIDIKNKLMALLDDCPNGKTLIEVNEKINEFIRYYSSLIYGTNEMN